jgi:hypothetical protein
MNTYLWIVPFLGLTALIVFFFLAFQRWTAGKQQQMSPEEFRLWFQKNDMGVSQKAGADAPLNRGEGETKTPKASTAIHQVKPAS